MSIVRTSICAALAAVALAACGGGDGGTPADASSEETTVCGTMQCQTANQICVIATPIGPGQSYSCQQVPAACASDRSCACAAATLCTGAFDVCSDAEDDNTIVCECPQCQ